MHIEGHASNITTTRMVTDTSNPTPGPAPEEAYTDGAGLGVAIAVMVIIAVIVVFCVMLTKYKRRRRREAGHPSIPTVSGTMGSNVEGYRNYGEHIESGEIDMGHGNYRRQMLYSDRSSDSTLYYRDLPPMAIDSPPPNYFDVIKDENEAQSQSNNPSRNSSIPSTPPPSYNIISEADALEADVSADVSPNIPQGEMSADVSSNMPQGEMSADVSSNMPQGEMSADVSSNMPQGEVSADVSSNMPQGEVSADVTSNIPQVEMSADVTSNIPQADSTTQHNDSTQLNDSIQQNVSIEQNDQSQDDSIVERNNAINVDLHRDDVTIELQNQSEATYSPSANIQSEAGIQN